MNDTKKSKAIEKVKKLLALGDSTNPHEAAIALKKAQRLIEEFKISNDDLDLSTICKVEVKDVIRSRKFPEWLARLLGCFQKTFGVQTLRQYNYVEGSRVGESVIYFIGAKDRAEIAGYCYEVIGRVLMQAREEFAKSVVEPDSKKKRRILDQFCNGWVIGVGKNITETFVDEKEETARQEFMKQNFPSVKSVSFKRKYITPAQADAFDNGVDEGSKVSLMIPIK